MYRQLTHNLRKVYSLGETPTFGTYYCCDNNVEFAVVSETMVPRTFV